MLNPKNKKAINWISAEHFLIDMYGGFLNPILPFIAANLNITLSIATSIISISQITSSITQPIFGYMADKCKKRFFLFFGLFFASLFLSLTTIAPNVTILAIFIILGSLGISFFHPQASGLTNYFCYKKKVTNKMSVYLTAGTLGAAFGPIVSSFITDFISIKALPSMAIIGIVYAFTLFMFVPKVKYTAPQNKQPSFLSTIKAIFRCKTTRILVFLSIIKAMIQVTYLVLLPFFWKSQGISASKIGTFIFLFLLVGSLGTLASSFLEKVIGTKNTIIISLTFPLLFTILFVLNSSNILISTIFFLIVGFFIMLSTPINITLAQKAMPKYKSTLAGLTGGFSFGFIGLFLPLIGYLSEIISIPYMLIVLSIIPCIFSYIVKYVPDELIKSRQNINSK